VRSERLGSSTSRFDFGSLARGYDAWYRTPHGATHDALQKRAVGRLLEAHRGNGALLDIGCGTGHWARHFSQCGFAVTGLDASAEMIEVARSKEIPNAVFARGDAQALPFDDGRFDVVTVITTLEFVFDPARVVQEAFRCTNRRRGATVVVVLNRLSRLNRRRRAVKDSPYERALLFSPAEVRDLLPRCRETVVFTTGFVPGPGSLVPLAPYLTRLCELLRLPYGAVIVGRAVA
jgi:ubiquinone/menaquinone biosynthesis C-methylase UbiE